MPPSPRPVRIRWWIFAFTLAFPTLSYIQRLSVQDLAGTVMPALHVSQLQIAWLATAFTTAYALAQLPGGIFCQQVGVRWTLVVVGISGFIATLAFPLAPLILAGTALFGTLLLAQALLGVSQGPLFSAATAVVESWLPLNRWAMGGGLQAAAMNFGGAVTPLLVGVGSLEHRRKCRRHRRTATRRLPDQRRHVARRFHHGDRVCFRGCGTLALD